MKPLLLALTVCALTSASEPPPRMPMPNDYTRSIQARWLAKPVSESRLIDGMEDLSSWKLLNIGQANGELTVSKERSVQGSASLRLRTRTTGDKPVPNDRYYGMTAALRVVNNEDWSAFNRLSISIYPDLPGFRVVSLLLIFHNDGTEKVPDAYGKMGMNYVLLRDREWNTIVWEIANLSRNRVTGIELRYMMQGHEPAASDIATFDFDNLQLQKVSADHYEGWNVTPGEISYSHSGYQAGSTKTAISSDLDAREFQLVNKATGKTVLSKPVRVEKSKIGEFQVLDFTEVREPGNYYLRAGSRTTRPFPIGDDVWKSSIWKALNFFYTERCGFAIPGVHDACHRDWVLKHGDKSLIVNGGWHDAGDLSQSFGNTAETAYAMFSLAARLEARGEDPELANRLIEEAQWGLDWVLKTSFGDGFRPTFSTMDRWTNGILGDPDDMIAQAGNSPAGNFMAAATEAIAARVLRKRDPVIAQHSLREAERDWNFALAGQPRGSQSELAGHAVIAAVELWKATNNRAYAAKAIEYGQTILDSQQRAFLPGLDYPLAGLFYTGPDKQRVLRYQHTSQEAAPVEALIQLCQALPDDPHWIQWYSAVTLYSEYFQKPMAALSAPYRMLANSVYKDDEYLKPVGMGRGVTPESYRAQVLNGIKVGEHHYVRLFPVWFEFRGNYGTALTQTKALSSAAHLRGNLDLSSLSQEQVQWVLGRNPFVQSTMWGEGYDYAPQYSAMSGDLVGSLPVGIQTHANADKPYWPTENCHNWKEVWVLPVARWFWLMRDLAGPALVEGEVTPGERSVELRELKSGKVTHAAVDRAASKFRTTVPEGEYVVSSSGERKTVTLLPGGTYSFDLRPGHAVDFKLSAQVEAGGTVTITATVEGSGAHKFTLRADNLQMAEGERQVEVRPGAPQSIAWKGKRIAGDTPWVAVVFPDGDISQRKEATGPSPAHPGAAR